MGEWSDRYSAIRLDVYESILGAMRPGRLLDLGAGHGAFSRSAHELGWQVTALDARDARFPEDLRGVVDFRLSLVEDLEWNPDEYDLICCLGLYYHLTYAMQESLLAHCARTPLLLDTHFATLGVLGEFHDELGDWETHEGIVGRPFAEVPQFEEHARKTDGLLASFNNDSSFWPTRESLLEQLRRHGYRNIWQFVHDFEPVQRTFFLALGPQHREPQ